MRTRMMLCPSVPPSCPTVPTPLGGGHKLKVREHFTPEEMCPLTSETVSAPLPSALW